MKKLVCLLLFLFPSVVYGFDWHYQVAIYALHYDVSPSLAISIVDCESGGDPKAINYNTNGTSDYGLFQWNDIWIDTFKHKGLDIKNNPIDNIEAGIQTLKNIGTLPWKASAKCWKKENALSSTTDFAYLAQKE